MLHYVDFRLEGTLGQLLLLNFFLKLLNLHLLFTSIHVHFVNYALLVQLLRYYLTDLVDLWLVAVLQTAVHLSRYDGVLGLCALFLLLHTAPLLHTYGIVHLVE